MEAMNANDRRQQLLETLCQRRHDTYDNLAHEFGVSKRTIRYDIETLSLSYPVKTVSGRYGGGVEVEEWYHLNRKTMSPEQAALLKRLAASLGGNDLETMNSIITQFAPYL